MKKFFTFVTVAAMALAAQAETFTVGGVSFNMVKVEAGTFTMGAEDDSPDTYSFDKPAHQVTLTKDYFIGQTEVTQELWLAVMGTNPSYYTSENWPWVPENHLNQPVEYVSWYDCQEFISKLNEMTGKQFRLPTEAEWEYAARGGNKSQGYYYAGSNNIEDVAWCKTNDWDGPGQHYPLSVGTKAPNELGLYDMTGNVWEWVNDWASNYSAEPQINPTGPENGTERIARGGSFMDMTYLTVRYIYEPEHRDMKRGLRLALTETEAPVEPTLAPAIAATPGNQSYTVTVTNNVDEPNAVIYVSVDGGDYVVYTGPITFTEFGPHAVAAYAVAPGKNQSNPVSVTFTVDENTKPDPSAVNELSGEKAVAGVRYFNMAGQEMQEANGMTIVVTTYTDGSTSAVKVMR